MIYIMKKLFNTTQKAMRHYAIALWAGFLGGNVASFVKWGVEVVLPPRTLDRAIPPAEMLNELGLNVSQMVYHYSGHLLNWGVASVHHLFSIFFAMLYAYLAEIFPGIKLWQGVFFGLVITVLFHGIILPCAGWAPPLWKLPFAEIFSETLGHILWIWTIEIFRRDIRNRITGIQEATCG